MTIPVHGNTEHQTCASNLFIKVVFIRNAVGALYKKVDAQKCMEIKGKKQNKTTNCSASQISPQLAFKINLHACFHIRMLI